MGSIQKARKQLSTIKIVFVLIFVLSLIHAVSASANPSVFTTTPPTIDGQVAGWKGTSISLGHGWMFIQNDNSYLYLLVDLTGETTNNTPWKSATGGDYFWLTFDVNIDKNITPNVDLNYGNYPGTWNLCKQYYLGPGSWTGCSDSTSQFAAVFDTSPNLATPHRIYEFAIDLQEIKANNLVRIGLKTSSQTPLFTDDQPPNFYNDFSNLMEITLAHQPTPAPTTGSISVSSSPSGASIYLDGSYQDTTPYTINNVAASSHNVTLKLTGYQDCAQTISVLAGQTSIASCTLIQLGSISVSSSPSGASIYLDGSYQQTTPFTITNVAPGSHTVALQLVHYLDWSGTVSVASGQKSIVSATLTPNPGSISVSSSPSGASIYLDGSYKVTTPFTISNVEAGSHIITLRLTGYQDWSQTVNVVADQTTYISAYLSRQTGSIKISSDPTGADVYLDGYPKGITPIDIPDVPVGSHTIKLSKQDYFDIEEPITVAADQTTDFSRSLKHQTGSVEVSSNPTGADIYLDETYKGITPTTLTSIPTGTHSIVIKKFGYSDFYQSINVQADITKEVNASLNLSSGLILSLSSVFIFFIIGIVLIVLFLRRKKPGSYDSTQVDTTKVNKSISETVPLRADSRTVETVLKGKYKVIRLLHTGGMGLVYEGEYKGNKCIIKEPKPTTRVTERNYFLEKIKIEAEILSKIDHDNIVGYIDSFEENNSFYLVEEYVVGENLEDKFYNNPGSESDVLNCTLQLLNAVRYLHMKQIKHRDIKPNNLILTSDNKLVLIDFGTAKHFDRGLKEPKGISKSTMLGTQCYAAPEQWKGGTTEASDIFSIGRTIYFMLTGENPPNSSDARLDFTGKNVTKELADFAIKAAEPEIKDRYESVDQMINLLNIIKDDVGKMDSNTRVLT